MRDLQFEAERKRRRRGGMHRPGAHGLGLNGLVALGVLSFLLCVSAGSARSDDVVRHPGGFWKCRPGGLVEGEFDNEDPVGLAAHAHVATNCELHWSDGHGATYCFATPPSFLEFEDNPGILDEARAFWRLEHPAK